MGGGGDLRKGGRRVGPAPCCLRPRNGKAGVHGAVAEAQPQAAQRAARFAFAMKADVEAPAAELGYPINVRIGLHVGSAVAGVIGRKRPAFDCRGDAVNLASRLEHTAPAGAIRHRVERKMRELLCIFDVVLIVGNQNVARLLFGQRHVEWKRHFHNQFRPHVELQRLKTCAFSAIVKMVNLEKVYLRREAIVRPHLVKPIELIDDRQCKVVDFVKRNIAIQINLMNDRIVERDAVEPDHRGPRRLPVIEPGQQRVAVVAVL